MQSPIVFFFPSSESVVRLERDAGELSRAGTAADLVADLVEMRGLGLWHEAPEDRDGEQQERRE